MILRLMKEGRKEEYDPKINMDVDPGAYEYEDDYVETIKKWKRHISKTLMQNPPHIQVIVIKRRNNCLGTFKVNLSPNLVDIEENPTEESKTVLGR